MLVPAWPKYRKVNTSHKLNDTYDLNAPATIFLDGLLGSHYLSAGSGDNILLPYLPEIYHTIKDYVAITESESVELLNLGAVIKQTVDDQYVPTSDVEAIRRRERMLGIQANPITESLGFRRKRILNRYQTKPPFTIRYLQQQLDNLVGPGMTVVSVDIQDFILFVTANIDDATVFREVQHTVFMVKPANMVYQQNTSLVNAFGLEEHISKQTISWNYKLDGSWQLGDNMFATLGTEEVVK